MKVFVVIDLIYGDEGNPGIKLFRNEADAIAEESRLLANSPDDGNYMVVRETVELE